MKSLPLAPLIALLFPPVASAQYERFELGRRLIQLEQTWDDHHDAEAKKRSLQSLTTAVNRFFSFQFGSAAQSLDTARHWLIGKEPPSEAQRWCVAVGVNPATRLLDSGERELELELNPFYIVKGHVPNGAKIRFTMDHADPVEVELTKFPLRVKLPLHELRPNQSADSRLEWVFELDSKRFGTGSLTVSRIERLSLRLDVLREKLAALPTAPRSMELASLDFLVNLIQQLADRNTLETNFPAARLLAEAETIADTLTREGEFYSASRPGEFWAAVPVPRYDAVFRMFVPKGLDAKKPVPVVFALHGAGGSENLFFDGYGDGITRKLCEERGWIMVAPRSPGFLGTPEVGAILDELMTRYPIDPKRVYLVGHSMGAAQAIAVSQQIPDRLTGVAALGGGGQVKKGAKILELPYFVGVGSADFALNGSRSLSRSLKNEGVKSLETKEYADVEHMMIVREAMPDVFRLFDQWGK